MLRSLCTINGQRDERECGEIHSYTADDKIGWEVECNPRYSPNPCRILETHTRSSLTPLHRMDAVRCEAFASIMAFRIYYALLAIAYFVKMAFMLLYHSIHPVISLLK